MEPQNQNEQPVKSILVVDDDEGIREILQIAFATEGCSVTTAANGVEAMEILSHSPHYSQIPIILMTRPIPSKR